MAEEAVGLAKSLSWTVEFGPKATQSSQTTQEKAKAGRRFPRSSATSHTIDGDELHIGDRVEVPGTGLKGWYYKEGLMVDMNSILTSSDEENEWENQALRESIAETSIIRVRDERSPTLFGSGQVRDLGVYIAEIRPSIVFINHNLTTLQQKRLERYSLIRVWNQHIAADKRNSVYQLSVIDRFGMILRIFAERARTRVARLQLEVAWVRYMRTRLVRGQAIGSDRLFTLLGRDGSEPKPSSDNARASGGVGTLGGAGETQLELQRRTLNDREAKIRNELEAAKALSVRQIKDPSLKNYPVIAIIGYTNAGKTALMNFLTGANLLSKNLLFQTLNTTSRQLILPSGQFGLMLDTVGFITDLPHDLVEAFKATLEGIQTADILLHIRDIAHPMTAVQRNTVLAVLEEMGFTEEIWKPKYVEVLNKIDLLVEPLPASEETYPVVPISATEGTNCSKLLEVLDTMSMKLLKKRRITLVFPSEEVQTRLQWLRQNLNMDVREVQPYAEGQLSATVVMDELSTKRYLSHFNEEPAD